MAQKPSILFLNRVYPPETGATGRMLHDLARAFARSGWTVTVLTTAEKAVKQRQGGVRIVRVKAPVRRKGGISEYLAYAGAWFKMLWGGLSLQKHDVVVSMTDPPLLLLAGDMISRTKKSRHIHWCQDVYPDLLPVLGVQIPSFLQKFFSALVRGALKRCERIVVIGRCMGKRIKHIGVTPQKISVIPNWADPVFMRRRSVQGDMFMHPAMRTARPSEAQYRDETPRFRVLYAGSLGRAHPVEAVLDAAETLSKDCPDIEFVFAGMGAGFDRLAGERDRRGLQNIRLLPRQPMRGLRAFMESGDLHLVTMHSETEGLLVPSKFYPAMAVARPCVFAGPRGSEVAKVIKQFGAGTVVPPDHAGRLTKAIQAYRMDPDQWFKAYEGAKAAGQALTPEQSLKAWVKRVEGVVG